MVSRTVPNGVQARADDAVAEAWRLLAEVPDPEVPVVSVVDLGIVRAVEVRDDGDGGTVALVDITPTYSGCPAMRVIEDDVAAKLGQRFRRVEVRTVLSPAWTTDWMSDDAKRRLTEFGIAPPERPSLAAGRRLLPLSVLGGGAGGVTGRPSRCPLCGSAGVTLVSEFGSTACKAMYRCDTCTEPFDYFKAH